MPDVGWSMHENGKEQLNHGECGLKVSRVEARRLNDFERHAQVTIVQEIVARAFQIPVIEIKAPTRRTAPVALARQTAMYLMHVVFGMSLSAVGRHFGRDRTTASHACRQIEDRRDDPAFDLMVDRLEFAVWSVAIREFAPGQTVSAKGIHVGNLFVGLSQ